MNVDPVVQYRLGVKRLAAMGDFGRPPWTDLVDRDVPTAYPTRLPNMPAMYILKCGDGSYYVGSTWNVEGRLWQHQNGEGAAYTRRRQPVELVFVEEFESITAAYVREKQVQGWSRAKREALIRDDYDEIMRLARASRGDLSQTSASPDPTSDTN